MHKLAKHNNTMNSKLLIVMNSRFASFIIQIFCSLFIVSQASGSIRKQTTNWKSLTLKNCLTINPSRWREFSTQTTLDRLQSHLRRSLSVQFLFGQLLQQSYKEFANVSIIIKKNLQIVASIPTVSSDDKSQKGFRENIFSLKSKFPQVQCQTIRLQNESKWK